MNDGEILSMRFAMVEVIMKFFEDEEIPGRTTAVDVYKEQAAKLKERFDMTTRTTSFVGRLFAGDVDFVEEPIAIVILGGDFAFFESEPSQDEITGFMRDNLPEKTIQGIELHSSGLLMVV